MFSFNISALFKAIETDLQRMRKQKKNLIAKRRQLNKNNQQFDAQGERIEVDLSDADKYVFAKFLHAVVDMEVVFVMRSGKVETFLFGVRWLVSDMLTCVLKRNNFLSWTTFP